MLECSTLQGLWKCPKTKVASFSKTQGLSSARPTLHVGGRTFRLKGGDTCWRSVPRLTNGRGLEVCFAVKGEEGLSSRVQTPETAPVETRNEGNLVKQGKQFYQEISCQCANLLCFLKIPVEILLMALLVSTKCEGNYARSLITLCCSFKLL